MAATDLTGDVVTAMFVQQWYDLLSAHEPVEKLLALVSEQDLEMAFPPDDILRSHEDFRRWYKAVGDANRDQSHTVERLDTRRQGDTVNVDVTVLWQTTQTSDDVTIRRRVQQQWRLRELAGGRLVIVNYQVGELVPA
ncbi:MAG TPA: nuclear transport factor 2 family protein [Pseudonocardiaceae bacterium]